MKKIRFKLNGMIDVDDNVKAEEVERAISFQLGLLKVENVRDIPNIAFLSYVSRNTHYDSVELIDKSNRIAFETDNVKASELANKLLSAVSECGDYPVLNSTEMPVPGGDPVSYVVYHKGDDHFNLE